MSRYPTSLVLLAASPALSFMPTCVRVNPTAAAAADAPKARTAVRCMVPKESWAAQGDYWEGDPLASEGWLENVEVDVVVETPVPETPAAAFDVDIEEAVEEVKAFVPPPPVVEPEEPVFESEPEPVAEVEPPKAKKATKAVPKNPLADFEWKPEWTEALTDGIAAAVVGVGNAAEAVAKAQEQTGPAVDAVVDTSGKAANAVDEVAKFVEENDLALKAQALFELGKEGIMKDKPVGKKPSGAWSFKGPRATKKKPVAPPPEPEPEVVEPPKMAFTMPKMDVQLPKMDVPKMPKMPEMPKIPEIKLTVPKATRKEVKVAVPEKKTKTMAKKPKMTNPFVAAKRASKKGAAAEEATPTANKGKVEMPKFDIKFPF